MKRALLHIGVMLLALAPSAYLAWHFRDMPYLGAFGDDTIYWVGAKSLAAGTGYRMSSLPSQPSQTKYPPLYPLVLSLVWKANPSFPDNLGLALLAAWLMLPAYVAAAGCLFKEMGVGRAHRAVLCCVLALNIYPMLYSLTLLSDLMFSALALACCILTDRALRPERRGWAALAAGVLAGSAYLTKSAGIALLLAGPLAFLLRRHYRKAALFACATLPAVMGWNIWRVMHAPSSPDGVSTYYTSYFGYYFQTLSLRELPGMIWTNFNSLWVAAGELVVVKPSDALWATIAWRLLVLLAIAGAVRLARSRLTAYHLFAGAYVCLLLLWNYPPTQRLSLPLQPLLLAGFGYVFRRIVQFAERSFRSSQAPWAVAGPVVVLGLTLFSLFALASTYITIKATWELLAGCRRELAQTQRTYQWIKANLPEDAGFVAYDDAVFYLYTGRHACGIVLSPVYFYRRDAETLDQGLRSLNDYARRNGLHYLLLTPNLLSRELTSETLRRKAVETVRGNPGLTLLHDSPGGLVFRFP